MIVYFSADLVLDCLSGSNLEIHTRYNMLSKTTTRPTYLAKIIKKKHANAFFFKKKCINQTRDLANSSLCDPSPIAKRANTLFAETTSFLIQFEKGLYSALYGCTNCRQITERVPIQVEGLQVAEPRKDFGR